jgi:hypothetical protein
MNKYAVKDMYKEYKELHPESDVTYSLFSHYIERFNKKIIEKVLEGKTFYFGHNLGSVRIKRVKRNFNKPTIDWFETNKLKAQGINKHVYYTDEFWFRWYWDKYRAKVKNKAAYRFEPTKGPTGAKKQLIKLLKTDEFAQLNFKE